MRAWLRRPGAWAGMIILLAYMALALCSWMGLLAPDFDLPTGPSQSPPGPGHPLGTDLLGRDVLSRAIHSTRVALGVGLIPTLLAFPLGIALGLAAGYFRGATDSFVVFLTSTFASVPTILMLLALSFVLGKGLTAVYLAVGAVAWVDVCRIVRAETLRHAQRSHIESARLAGAGPLRILLVHILPSLWPPILAQACLQSIQAVKGEVILSFLGVGVQRQPSFGLMLANARLEVLEGAWGQLVAATGGILLLVLALNLIAEALMD